MVERVNRVLIPVIQVEMKNERCWDESLKKVQLNLNTAHNKSTSTSRFNILHGYHPYTSHAKVEEILRRTGYTDPERTQGEAVCKIKQVQEDYKRLFDRRHYSGQNYEVGEVVMVKMAAQATGESTKLQPKYKGPYVIVEILPSDTYGIEKLDPSTRVSTTVHVSQVKNYRNPNESETEDDDGETLLEEDDRGKTESSRVSVQVESQEECNEEMRAGKRESRVRRKPKWMDDYT